MGPGELWRRHRPGGWSMRQRGGLAVLGLLTCAFGLWRVAGRDVIVPDPMPREPMIGDLLSTLDPNEATARDLAALPGIGLSRGEAIVAYREAGGVYRRAEDLTAVKGIGPSLVETLRPHLHFGLTSVDEQEEPPAGSR